MCVVSAVGDHYSPGWKRFDNPMDLDSIRRINDGVDPSYWQGHLKPSFTQEEFNNLKQQVRDLKALLKIAVDYDRRNNEPNCEIEEKIATLRSVAGAFGIDIDEILK